ncbi:MAG: glycosyltransferase family 4 protein [Candidatus Aenigmatarchaeota archaeon]
MRKNILIISRDFPPNSGGISVYAYETFKRLSKKFNIKVFTTSGIKNKKIIRITKSSTDIFQFVIKSFLYGLEENFDIIFATTYFHALPGIFLKILKKKPLVTNIQDLGIIEYIKIKSLIKFIKYLVHKLAISYSDIIIVPSEIVKKDIKKFFKIKDEKIVVIPNGFNKSLFHPQINPQKVRKKLKISRNIKVILSVGLLPKKGTEYLVEACGLLKNKYNFDNFCLIIVGDKDKRFDRYYQKIEKIIRSYKLYENIKFVGSMEQKELRYFYKSCDVFVAASYYGEGFGIPCVEASAVGKPVVATKLFEKSGTVINNKTGLIVSPKNSIALAKAILKLLTNNKLRKTLGKNGIDFVKKFDWDDHCNKLIEIIDKIII